ncbi:hypothetical protein ACFOOM_01225 [Streptomyces echinoruber]|uniref:Uncharacterized protein n=1 Tax=Streptomyces echinoruber TaxID=68898 RepID=A0A918QXF1_9ACTN|nr:hypothetical protein [Streptomyces echinoruber]GGZ72917.1 hypothetical protein GCM10010389_07870 [Streptomyces echinoruber]
MTRYWHGGVPGRLPGDRLLPPAVTGTERTLTRYAHVLGASAERARRDRVYVATGRDIARVYAAFYPDGALYEVLPVGGMTADPDCLVDGVSWEYPAAVVVDVVDPVVLLRGRSVDAWLRLLNRATARAGEAT